VPLAGGAGAAGGRGPGAARVLPARRRRLADGGVSRAGPFGPAARRGVGAGALVQGAVLAHLAGVPVMRRVDCGGKIGPYYGEEYAGAVERGKGVVVRFGAGSAGWSVGDRSGAELCRRPLAQFGAAGMCPPPVD